MIKIIDNQSAFVLLEAVEREERIEGRMRALRIILYVLAVFTSFFYLKAHLSGHLIYISFIISLIAFIDLELQNKKSGSLGLKFPVKVTPLFFALCMFLFFPSGLAYLFPRIKSIQKDNANEPAVGIIITIIWLAILVFLGIIMFFLLEKDIDLINSNWNVGYVWTASSIGLIAAICAAFQLPNEQKINLPELSIQEQNKIHVIQLLKIVGLMIIGLILYNNRDKFSHSHTSLLLYSILIWGISILVIFRYLAWYAKRYLRG